MITPPPAPAPRVVIPKPKAATVIKVDPNRYYFAENIGSPFVLPGGEKLQFDKVDVIGGLPRGVYATADSNKIFLINRFLVGRKTGVKEITRQEYETRSGRRAVRLQEEIKLKPERTFYHSGDFGDIIYALPTIQRLGGGKLHLGPEMRLSRQTQTRETMSPAKLEMIYDLLKCQEYIDDVIYTPNYPNVRWDLNLFREYCMTFQSGRYWEREGFDRTRSLSEIHLYTFDLERGDETKPWLRADVPWEVDGKPIVIHRSHRYRNEAFPWKKLVDQHGDRMVFTGLKSEHNDFVKEVGYVDFFYVDNLLELARVIAGAKVFIGNQSCPYAIAEGMKKNTIQETWLVDPNCLFDRPNAIFGRNSDVTLPERWLE